MTICQLVSTLGESAKWTTIEITPEGVNAETVKYAGDCDRIRGNSLLIGKIAECEIKSMTATEKKTIRVQIW